MVTLNIGQLVRDIGIYLLFIWCVNMNGTLGILCWLLLSILVNLDHP